MIIIKTEEEIRKMEKSSKIAVLALNEVKKKVAPGVNTLELDKIAEEVILKIPGAWPAFKGYRGYKFSTCLSVNHEVVHGIPSEKKFLQEGDILSIDVGVLYDGFYGDVAETVPVGKINKSKKKLLETAKHALKIAIELFKPGVKLGKISSTIEKVAKSQGFSVVKNYYGHGIGRRLHEDPLVPNFGNPDEGPILKNGMVLAFEPMLNMGTSDVKTLDDGWTVVTCDGQPSAHFEHTVALLNGFPLVLTKN